MCSLCLESLDNKERRARVADLLSDFTQLQQYIAAAPDTPEDMDDYYTEGWKVLRQCSIDGQHILNCGADTTVPRARGGQEEQDKAELQQSVFSPTVQTLHTQTPRFIFLVLQLARLLSGRVRGQDP